MTKIIFSILFLFISLTSCQDTNNSTTDGTGPTPSDQFWPIGLSDKVIVSSGVSHAPMDFISQDLTLSFDTVTQKAKGTSVIRFSVRKTGRPYFELQSTVKNMKLDSTAVSVTSIKDPDGQNQSYWSVNQELNPGLVHEVAFEYELAAGRVSFISGGVRFLTDMTDLNGKFFEYWGPTGFEEDMFSLNLKMNVENSTSTHVLYTNGSITTSGPKVWTISFPEYFSKSSFYVHLTNQTTLPNKKFVYKGLEKDIPVEVYGLTSTLVSSAIAVLPSLFKELEEDYGPYPHTKFLAYMNDRSGGMEYVGATITSLASIDHELLHSWFGRSAIPADGRSGWIDEAMASWRDYGYTRAKSTLGRTPTNLANYSPFRKSTPSNSYVDGRGLMAELDLEFASIGGLQSVMKAFMEVYKNKVISNEEFWDYLENHTGIDLEDFRLRYAMGGDEQEVASRRTSTDHSFSPREVSKHPDPLTEEEILRLR